MKILLNFQDLRQRLSDLLHPRESWRFISLAKGYLNIHFSSIEDQDRILGLLVRRILNQVFFVFNRGD